MSDPALAPHRERGAFWLWLAGGLAVALGAVALALWAAYGPVVFVNALNTAWTCL